MSFNDDVLLAKRPVNQVKESHVPRLLFSEYKNAHLRNNCNGKFSLKFLENGFHTSSALGPIQVPCLPIVTCRKCEATFIPSKFKTWIDNIIADYLILSQKSLTRNQVRFLLQHFDNSIDEIGLHAYSKYKPTRNTGLASKSVSKKISLRDQFSIKTFFAKRVGIHYRDLSKRAFEANSKELDDINPGIFPCSFETKRAFMIC